MHATHQTLDAIPKILASHHLQPCLQVKASSKMAPAHPKSKKLWQMTLLWYTPSSKAFPGLWLAGLPHPILSSNQLQQPWLKKELTIQLKLGTRPATNLPANWSAQLYGNTHSQVKTTSTTPAENKPRPTLGAINGQKPTIGATQHTFTRRWPNKRSHKHNTASWG